jgi:phosphoserine phosphatase
MTNNLPPFWPTYQLVIFDCDSTLVSIEGIDELAHITEQEENLPGAERSAISRAASIASLTKRAMEGDLPLEAVYGQRLMAVNPTRSQVQKLAGMYRQRVIQDARQVVEALQAHDVQVFIVSGGLIEPIQDFGAWLGIPRQNIFAVDVEYDQLAGRWWRYWEQPGGQNPSANHLAFEANPLTGSGGKNRVIGQIRAMYPGRALMVGDGLSDLEARQAVDLFIGFGGVVYRPIVVRESLIYIHTPSLSPVFPLALGQSGQSTHYVQLWADGIEKICAGEVSFKDPEMHSSFLAVLRRFYPTF